MDVATVSQAMERLQATENSPVSSVSISNTLENSSLAERGNQHTSENVGNNSLNENNVHTSFAAGSALN